MNQQKTKKTLILSDILQSGLSNTELSDKISFIHEQLEGGSGFVVLRGFPVENYTQEEIEKLFWAFGQYIGTPEKQDKEGNLLHHVRDTGKNILESDNVRGYQTNVELRDNIIPFRRASV